MPPDPPVTTTPLPAKPVSIVRSLTAQKRPHRRRRNEPCAAGLARTANVVRVEEAAVRELRTRVPELALEAQGHVATIAETEQMQADAEAVNDEIPFEIDERGVADHGSLAHGLAVQVAEDEVVVRDRRDVRTSQERSAHVRERQPRQRLSEPRHDLEDGVAAADEDPPAVHCDRAAHRAAGVHLPL